MRTNVFCLAFLVAAGSASADIVIPEQDACTDKRTGDPCGDGGVCASDGFSCQAGACRRHADESACRSEEGCRWQESLRCQSPTPTPTPTPATATTPTPTTATTPERSGCAAMDGTSGLALLAALGVRRRRR
jgi:hypothetical protein